jgi:phenylacetic acid degradation operon negative regulatory protein
MLVAPQGHETAKISIFPQSSCQNEIPWDFLFIAYIEGADACRPLRERATDARKRTLGMAEIALVTSLVNDMQITAASFIVTVYGDVVVPRGEVLWMGSLIEICNRIGIRENLVRTAVSRLVVAGRLQGERQGRRSFYRLAPTARAEFAQATARLYTHDARPAGWQLLAVDELPDETRRQFHMAQVGGGCWLAPDWGQMPDGARLVMRVPDSQPEAMPGIAAFWELRPLQDRYDTFLARFLPVATALEQGHTLTPADALTLRLLLVHSYRAAVLRDPFLPVSLLPQDWSGTRARELFRNLYLALTPPAELDIAVLADASGFLPASTPESMQQINRLR